MQQLTHEKLDVYKQATQLLAIAHNVLNGMPKGHASLNDQLKRASLSVVLNIAEAAGKPTRGDNKKYFAIARGSALECAAALDACEILKLADSKQVCEAKQRIVRVVSMLTKLCL